MSEEMVLQSQLNLEPLDTQTREIAQKILDEQDVDKVKDLTALFNLNTQKRNVIRVMKMNSLLDGVTDQILERFEKRADNFSNEELLSKCDEVIELEENQKQAEDRYKYYQNLAGGKKD